MTTQSEKPLVGQCGDDPREWQDGLLASHRRDCYLLHSAVKTFTYEQLRDAMTLEPCHVTGEHDPTHTPRYVCARQRAEAYKRVPALLGLDEAQLPRRLHEGEYWCTSDDGKGEHGPLHDWAARR